jgi:hypothetical protein
MLKTNHGSDLNSSANYETHTSLLAVLDEVWATLPIVFARALPANASEAIEEVGDDNVDSRCNSKQNNRLINKYKREENTGGEISQSQLNIQVISTFGHPCMHAFIQKKSVHTDQKQDRSVLGGVSKVTDTRRDKGPQATKPHKLQTIIGNLEHIVANGEGSNAVGCDE